MALQFNRDITKLVRLASCEGSHKYKHLTNLFECLVRSKHFINDVNATGSTGFEKIVKDKLSLLIKQAKWNRAQYYQDRLFPPVLPTGLEISKVLSDHFDKSEINMPSPIQTIISHYTKQHPMVSFFNNAQTMLISDIFMDISDIFMDGIEQAETSDDAILMIQWVEQVRNYVNSGCDDSQFKPQLFEEVVRYGSEMFLSVVPKWEQYVYLRNTELAKYILTEYKNEIDKKKLASLMGNSKNINNLVEKFLENNLQ